MKSPYDKKEVRWALALAINMYEMMLTGYDGIQILTATHAGQGMVPFELYHKGMLEWLKEFTFPDGYKPFDPTLPYKLADYAEMKGYTVPGEPVDIWGGGWWKYDTFKAAEMLEAQGFSKGTDGKWYLPDGKLWIITLNATTLAYEIDASRLAFVVAEQWRKFGIDVKITTLEYAPLSSDISTGEFEVASFWNSSAQGGIIDDLWYTHKWWHKDNIQPLGVVSILNTVRWANDRVSALLDELSAIHPDDPKARELSYKVLKEMIREMPILPTFGCKKFSPYDTYYWKNFPSAENPYWSPLFWCGGFKWITPHLEPTGRLE